MHIASAFKLAWEPFNLKLSWVVLPGTKGIFELAVGPLRSKLYFSSESRTHNFV